MKLTIKKKVEVDIKTLHVRAGVRYWEDATVNGVEDKQGDLIPCRDGDDWKPIINIETGQITNWGEGKIADIHYKICDDGDYYLKDNKDEEIIHHEGYVPKLLCPERNGYGDYIIMKVDKNGFIKNFKFDISEFIEDKE